MTPIDQIDADDDDILAAQVPPVSSRPLLVILGGGLLLLAQAAFIAAFIWFTNERELENQIDRLRLTTEVAASAHAGALATWASTYRGIAEGLVADAALAGFAQEAGATESAEGLASFLATNLDRVQSELDQFVSRAAMKGLYIMGRSGNVIATGGHPPLPSDQMRSRASDLLKTQSPDPVLFLDEADGNILLIFMAPFSGADGAGAEVVLVGSVAVSSDIVSGIGAAAGGDNALSLYQRLGEDMVRIDPEGNLPMASVEGEEAKRVLEAQQVFLSTKGRLTYGATRRIVGTPWYLRMELAVGDELGWLNLLDRKEIAIILGSLLIVDIILLLLIVRRFQRQGAEYRRGHAYLVRRLQSRQALFDGIARTINAVVGVKDQKGRYSYANSAFGDFVGRDPTEVLGLDDAALFSENVAKLIKGLDSDALSSVQPVSSLEDVSLEGRDLHLRLSTFALRDAEKKPTGVMMVAQDVTDPVMMARQRQTSLQQTIAALSDTVGLADPYLSGHGVKVRNLAMAVGRLLSVTETEMAAIETGAILSQIGKLGVPHEILTKEGRLTPQEFEVMKTHIQHTLRVVEGIDFQHPVQTALAHMYERMDGSGYPKGLSAADISIMGRILGAADIFIARTSPRSYRNAISPAEALETFDYAPEKYDRMVIDGIRIVENL